MSPFVSKAQNSTLAQIKHAKKKKACLISHYMAVFHFGLQLALLSVVNMTWKNSQFVQLNILYEFCFKDVFKLK